MLLKMLVNIIVVLYLCCGYHAATVTTTKKLQSGGSIYTWNFIFDDKTASSFEGLQETITGDSSWKHSQTGDERVPLDIDVRSGDTPVEDSKYFCGQNCWNRYGVYWREWKGYIPDDAIVGSYVSTSCGVKAAIHLAQAYTPQNAAAGLQATQIFNYSTSVSVSFEGVHQVSNPVKVLCGSQEAVAWIPVQNAAALNPETDFVVAGFERDFNTFFARSRYNGSRIIGKSVWQDKVMYYPADGAEKSEKIFDVLCYRDKLLEKNVRIPSEQIDI